MKKRINNLKELVGKTIAGVYQDFCTEGIILVFDDSYCHFTVNPPGHSDDTYNVWLFQGKPIIDEGHYLLVENGVFTQEEVDKRLNKERAAVKRQQERHERQLLERLKEKYDQGK